MHQIKQEMERWQSFFFQCFVSVSFQCFHNSPAINSTVLKKVNNNCSARYLQISFQSVSSSRLELETFRNKCSTFSSLFKLSEYGPSFSRQWQCDSRLVLHFFTSRRIYWRWSLTNNRRTRYTSRYSSPGTNRVFLRDLLLRKEQRNVGSGILKWGIS